MALAPVLRSVLAQRELAAQLTLSMQSMISRLLTLAVRLTGEVRVELDNTYQAPSGQECGGIP
jgi:hypothetical protein